VGPSNAAGVQDAGTTVLSPAQGRVITAALKLFARHGVGGTSL
jgi:hypothetical protein